jgi:hypothetical protein
VVSDASTMRIGRAASPVGVGEDDEVRVEAVSRRTAACRCGDAERQLGQADLAGRVAGPPGRAGRAAVSSTLPSSFEDVDRLHQPSRTGRSVAGAVPPKVPNSSSRGADPLRLL